MIVDPDQPGSPVDERSPLKGPTSGPPPQPENQGPSYSAPPPPYAPSQPTYQSGIPPYPIPVQHGQPTFRPAHGEPRGEPALQRIAKAYIIALLILFLWGIFVDSVDMLSSHHGKRRPYLDSVKSSWWKRPTTSAGPPVLSPCGTPQIVTPSSIRNIPISYPVAVSRSETAAAQ